MFNTPRSQPDGPPASRLWQIAFYGYLAVVLALTLRPDPAAATLVTRTPWSCLVCGESGAADILLNLLLMLPLGLALGRLGWPRPRIIALLVLLPLGIELTQGLWLPGRDATLSDVLTNTLGGGIGYLIGRRPGPLRPPAPLVLGAFVAQLALTAVLVRPWIDGRRPWRFLVNPVVAGRPQYHQPVGGARLGGEPVWSWSAPPPIRPDLRNDPSWVIQLAWDPPSSTAVTPIVVMQDSLLWGLASADRRGQYLGMSLRDRAGWLRLLVPTFRVEVPEGTAAGDPLDLSLEVPPGRLILSVTGPAGTRILDLRRGAQHGWSMLNPFAVAHRSVAEWRAWTLGWLLGWGLLLGWSVRGRRHPSRWGGGALVAFLLLCWFGGAPATIAEVLALALGWSLPALSSRRSRRRRAAA